MRLQKGRLQGRGLVAAALAAVVGVAGLAAGPRPGPPPAAPASHPVVPHGPSRPAAPVFLAAGRTAHHYFPPLELVAAPPERAPVSARTIAQTSGGPNGVDAGDGSFWPDSSSPVRNPPSNATTGPASLTLPRFPGWQLTKVGVPGGSRQRYFLVARPAVTTDSSLPLLLVLPGRDMTPATIARASGFLRLVGQAVVVFPAGFANSWNAGYCCGVAHLAGVNDVAFLETVLRTALAMEPGTSARDVYIAGFSNGGRMALDMACADPGAFAGVAAVEAVAVSSCPHPAPVPILEVASTADPLLTVLASAPPKHIAGHVEVTVQALVDLWRTLDGCGAATSRSDYPGLTLTEWPACRDRSRVAMAVYDGGRHAWPAGGRATPPAQAVIWDFFHGGTPTAPAGVGPAA